MKRFTLTLGVIGLICVIGLSFFGCDNGSTSVDNRAVLVCFGDSLTAGTSATTPYQVDKSRSYPAFLQKKVNMKVENLGDSGDTTVAARDRINTVIDKNPRIVIIEFGANDCFSRIPVAETMENLDAIITILNDGNRKLYLAKFYNDTVVQYLKSLPDLPIIGGFKELANKKDEYDLMFSALESKHHGIELIEDIWADVWGIHMGDPIHPNAEGYEIMAEHYYNALFPYLLENDFL